MNIAEWLAATARRTPHAPAILDGDRVVADYAAFAASAASVAGLLSLTGVRPGDRVAVYLDNRPEFLTCLWGIWWLGAVAVPVNRKLVDAEVATILADCDARVVFTDTDPPTGATGLRPPPIVPPAAFAPPASREADDVAWIFYTSGTTGRPKGATLTNANLLAMSLCQLADVDGVEPGDAVLYAAPLSHGAGLYGLVHVRKGTRHVLPPSRRFDADEVLDLAGKVPGVVLFAAPTMVRRLVAAARARGGAGDGIRTVIYGGGPMYLADIRAAIDVFGHRFAQIYGQGESPMTITSLSKVDHTDGRRLTTVGTAQSAVQVRVNESGEVEVKGATVMAGYWNNPAATAEALHDGWLRTGDLGRIDAEGYLTLVGRSKELIVSGGSNIYPREVEDVLVTHPTVAEAAVVGRADPEWGEIVVAYVVGVPGVRPDPDDLDRHCRAAIARFKRPRHYHVVTDLPKNAYGKVVKSALVEEHV